MFSARMPTTDSLNYVHLLSTMFTLSPGILSHSREDVLIFALTHVQPRYPDGLFQRQDRKPVQARVDGMPWDEIDTVALFTLCLGFSFCFLASHLMDGL